MRQRNHCSSLKGIPKMKLQGSGPSTPKSLQSQNRPRPENRLSISRLDVVHGQLDKRRAWAVTIPVRHRVLRYIAVSLQLGAQRNDARATATRERNASN